MLKNKGSGWKSCLEIEMSDEYYFFYASQHPFSNFYAIEGNKSVTSEKFFMMSKAEYFGDQSTLAKISTASTPMEAKKLGRQVKPYDDQRWASVRYDKMSRALLIKFDLCPAFRRLLRNNWRKTIVEASKYDRIWGIGFYEKDALANFDKWGANLLGRCLNELGEMKFGRGS